MRYRLNNIDDIPTPALVFYKEAIHENIAAMVKIAGCAGNLRPHVKTHKTVEIARMCAAAGITKFKTATIAETEMLLEAGIQDIVLAYPLAGANIARFLSLKRKYNAVNAAALIDTAMLVGTLSGAAEKAGITLPLLIDIDAGMRRTGLPFDRAAELYRSVATAKNLRAVGLHIYDGHNTAAALEERAALAAGFYTQALQLKRELESGGLPVEKVIIGGTPPFPCYAKLSAGKAGIELSPGTCVLNDYGYGSKYADMPFRYAALILTRVVSRPAGGSITFDLGYKAVASDPAADNRARLVRPLAEGLSGTGGVLGGGAEPAGGEGLAVIESEFLGHSEEHWMVKADIEAPTGTTFYALPTHICPCSALYDYALVADGEGNITEKWRIKGRSRFLSV